MAADIVSGLFGLSPGQIQQQQLAGDDAAAMQYAKLDPFQKANYSLGMGARGLTRTGAGMLGMQRPEEIEAQNRTAAMTDLNIQDPRAILERAAQTQDPRIRMQLQLLAQQRQKEIAAEQAAASKMALDEAKTERERATAEKALRDTPTSQAAAIQEYQLAKQTGFTGSFMDFLKTKAMQTPSGVKVELGGAGGAAVKPKGLSKPASLKWDLDKGYIDQETYDREIQKEETPMPPAAIKIQDDAIEAINNSEKVINRTKAIVSDIEQGRLNLGMMANLSNRIKSGIGVSTKDSVALADFQTDLEKLRNDVLLLHKGTQTEGDATRAMNTIVQNINDPNVVKSQMVKLQELNKDAVTLQQRRLKLLRAEYGKGALDVQTPEAPAGEHPADIQAILNKSKGAR